MMMMMTRKIKKSSLDAVPRQHYPFLSLLFLTGGTVMHLEYTIGIMILITVFCGEIKELISAVRPTPENLGTPDPTLAIILVDQ
jgi:hypothetical protein